MTLVDKILPFLINEIACIPHDLDIDSNHTSFLCSSKILQKSDSIFQKQKVPDSDALGFEKVPSLVHFFQPLLNYSGVFLSVYLTEYFSSSGGQRQVVLAFSVHFNL